MLLTEEKVIDMKNLLLDERTLRQIKAPTLCHDEKWLEIMAPYMKDTIGMLVERQKALIEEERQAGRHLMELKRQKRSALSQLLDLAGRLQENDSEAESQAERLKVFLERVNDEMDQIQYKVETAPAEIRRLNTELLEESIPLGYDKLLKDHERIHELDETIQKLRSELLAMNEEKFALEDRASAMGQYLHSLLGKELSDELDARFMLDTEERIR